MTLYDMIHKALHARAACEGKPDRTFTVEEITLEAWKMYPQSFGLKGFEDRHPNHNKVVAALAEANGPLKRGWLRKAGKGLYQLTDAAPGEALTDGQKLVKSLMNKAASRFLRDGGAWTLQTPDALDFYGVSQLTDLPGAAAKLEKRLAALHQDPSVGERDLNFLRSVVNALAPIVERADLLALKAR